MKFLQMLVPCFWLFALTNFTLQADVFDTFGTTGNQFELAFVQIGDPGNAADSINGQTQIGSVGYRYRMGKFEISRDMINKTNAAGNLGITLADMSSLGGNGAQQPATGISWHEAARFVNWLNTSKGYAPAYKFAVQPGEPGYSATSPILMLGNGDLGFDASNPYRNKRAKYFLPNANEWHKAAYYDPTANGGAGGYWDFPTGGDTLPTPVAGGTTANTAVFEQDLSQGPARITNAGGLSRFGVMGMGGNVYEWEETELDFLNNNPALSRGLRGGSWSLDGNQMRATSRPGFNPLNEVGNVGFRVASIPEPSFIWAGVFFALACMTHRRKSNRS